MAKRKEPRTPEMRALDPASIEMLTKAEVEGLATAFSRMDTQDVQCKFGNQGLCCRVCHMGPCRITPKSAARGVRRRRPHRRRPQLPARGGRWGGGPLRPRAAVWCCCSRRWRRGSRAATPSATSGRCAATPPSTGSRTSAAARRRSPPTSPTACSPEFTSQESPLKGLELAPLKRQGVWRRHGVEPLGIDRMLVESMHRSTMGVDHDHRNLLQQAMRTALADGWGGSRIAGIISDILFGTPQPVRGNVNLGVLGENTVNIVVHGHEPVLSEMLVVAVRDPEIEAAAVRAGADGVTLAGICCTANEILMRHGIPVAGNFLQQELAIITGAVEMMMVDVQCCMPSLPEVAAAYHTEIVSTSRDRPDRRRHPPALRRGPRLRGRQGAGAAGHRQLSATATAARWRSPSTSGRWSAASRWTPSSTCSAARSGPPSGRSTTPSSRAGSGACAASSAAATPRPGWTPTPRR